MIKLLSLIFILVGMSFTSMAQTNSKNTNSSLDFTSSFRKTPKNTFSRWPPTMFGVMAW
jgi:glucose uptake protein GlcU